VLLERVVVVGCQPESCDDFDEVLSPHVAAAVPLAAQRVRELVMELAGAGDDG
jgi:Ni,Fe-hydrogenase maturation factor